MSGTHTPLAVASVAALALVGAGGYLAFDRGPSEPAATAQAVSAPLQRSRKPKRFRRPPVAGAGARARCHADKPLSGRAGPAHCQSPGAARPDSPVGAARAPVRAS